MKLPSDIEGSTNKIKVEILEINGDTIRCKHPTSGYEMQALIKSDMKLQVGQVVVLEYRKDLYNGRYIVFDELMEEIDATVLEAQHIISEGKMYTSLILENSTTKQRLHSLVPSNNTLFGNTSIIITGDKVKLRINNGNLFSIQV